MVEYKKVALSNLGLDEVGSNPTYHKKKMRIRLLLRRYAKNYKFYIS